MFLTSKKDLTCKKKLIVIYFVSQGHKAEALTVDAIAMLSLIPSVWV